MAGDRHISALATQARKIPAGRSHRAGSAGQLVGYPLVSYTARSASTHAVDIGFIAITAQGHRTARSGLSPA